MTAPAPPTESPPEKFDDCAVFVDKELTLVCGDPGVDEVKVRNGFGVYCVALCREHRKLHRQFYNRLNAASAANGRPRRH